MTWPNDLYWSAHKEGEFSNEERRMKLEKVSCGHLKMPSGKLIVCDPFTVLQKNGNAYLQIAPGEYEVFVTVADVSEESDGSHTREAYASLILNPSAVEITRKILGTTEDGNPPNVTLAADEYWGYGVDSGTSCFCDAENIEKFMPPEENWYEGLFENGKPDCWFNLMDNDSIRSGIANIPLPLAKDGENLILFHSGWGDGFYPIIGGFDAQETLVAVHTDFFVVSHPEETEDDVSSENVDKPWWRFW